MRSALFVCGLFIAMGATACGAEQAGPALNWEPWRHVPVQDGGRVKPLDTLAWETLRTLCNRASFSDPETGEKLNPTAWYLAIVLEWPGWDRAPAGPAPAAEHHFLQRNDKWDNAPLLRVDYLPLRESLGMPSDEKYIAPHALVQAKIRDPQTGAPASFLLWAQTLRQSEPRALSEFDRRALDLAGNYWAYQSHRSGKRLALAPAPGGEAQQWLSAAELMKAKYTDATDPTGGLRGLQEKLRQVRAAYLAGSSEEFNAAAHDLIAALAAIGAEVGDYPDRAAIDLEVAYNRYAPFRFGWVLTMLAFLCALLSVGTRWKGFYLGGLATFAAGLAAMAVGFGMRIAISGRAPVTNMYESVVYLALGTAVFGLVFEVIFRKGYVLAAAAAVSTLALVLADNSPAILNPSLQPLEPVLRTNFWLVTHVMTITLSYAALALALGIGNITLGCCLRRSPNERLVGSLSRFTYKALQVGVLLLATGTILGAVWADYAWGRFWGWDPKEVWALIALFGYLAVLHARYAGWVRDLGLAALSVVCFSLVVMAWYGVNYVLGAGKHSYGFGGGGQGYVFGAIGLQFLYVGASVLIASKRRSSAVPKKPRPAALHGGSSASRLERDVPAQVS